MWLSPFVAVLQKLPHSQSIVGGFARLVCQCHAKTHLSPVATWVKVLWDWNTISVDESWTLQHVFENLADSSDGCDEGDLWMLDTALRDLPLVCKVGLTRKGDFQRILLSLTVEDALEFGKHFWYIMQKGGEGSGVAQSTGQPAPKFDTSVIKRGVYCNG